MNVSQLSTFVAVVDTGSFSAAAKQLGVSQPAVTMQVQALEAAIGVTLLDRQYRRIDLTEAGKALLPHARRVLAQLDEARADIQSLSGRVGGHLLVAASTTPGDYIVPFALGSFVTQYEELGVTVVVMDTARVIEQVESGAAHIGVTGGTARGARVSVEEIGTDDLLLIAPKAHPAAAKPKIRLADLCEERWVFRESGSGTRVAAERLLDENGLDPTGLRVAVELGTGQAVVSAVEGGLGIAVVSRYVAEKALALGTVAQVDAVGLPAKRPLYAVLPKGTPTRAALAFFEHLKTHASR